MATTREQLGHIAGIRRSAVLTLPVPPEDFGTQEMRAVQQAITRAQMLNPGLQLLGHVVTRYDRRLLVHRAYEQKLRQLYVESVLHTMYASAEVHVDG